MYGAFYIKTSRNVYTLSIQLRGIHCSFSFRITSVLLSTKFFVYSLLSANQTQIYLSERLCLPAETERERGIPHRHGDAADIFRLRLYKCVPLSS